MFGLRNSEHAAVCRLRACRRALTNGRAGQTDCCRGKTSGRATAPAAEKPRKKPRLLRNRKADAAAAKLNEYYEKAKASGQMNIVHYGPGPSTRPWWKCSSRSILASRQRP